MFREEEPGLASRRVTDRQWKTMSRRYGGALRVADGHLAEATALESLNAGLSFAGVCTRVIAPAMHWIGELWERQAITVADEHVATAICHRTLASLYANVTPQPRDTRETVLLACPEGQHHGLGLRMTGDVLETAGFDVVYLGTDVPPGALAAAVASYEPAVVGLSLTMPLGVSRLEEAIAAVGAARPGTPVLLGGQGVPRRLLDGQIPYAVNVEAAPAEVARVIRDAASPAPHRREVAPNLRGPVSSDETRGIGTSDDLLLQSTIEMGKLVREQSRLSAHFRALAFEDHLCALPNRRAFDDRFGELTAEGAPTGLAVMVLDIDRFKQINDRDGHREGDRALRLVADALRASLRADDLPARLGGDEFAAILPALGLDDARRLAARLQRNIFKLAAPLELTVSIGLAWFDVDRRRTMLQADVALYDSKQGGLNLITIANGQHAESRRIRAAPSGGPAG